MNELYEASVEGESLVLHAYEVAYLVGVQSNSDPKAPLRGFCSEAVGYGAKIGAHRVSGSALMHKGVHGAQLVRSLNAYGAVPGAVQVWFIPFSSFGLVRDMESAAVRIQ